jgi:hypothetical protein
MQIGKHFTYDLAPFALTKLRNMLLWEKLEGYIFITIECGQYEIQFKVCVS